MAISSPIIGEAMSVVTIESFATSMKPLELRGSVSPLDGRLHDVGSL